jgi:hypothetical protein
MAINLHVRNTCLVTSDFNNPRYDVLILIGMSRYHTGIYQYTILYIEPGGLSNNKIEVPAWEKDYLPDCLAFLEPGRQTLDLI